MVRIREQQLQSLADDACKRVALVLRDRVRTDLPHLAAELADDELARQISSALARGTALALKDEALVFYVLLALELGPEFDRHPAFHDILTHVERPSAMRLTMLQTVITATDVEEAKRARDAAPRSEA